MSFANLVGMPSVNDNSSLILYLCFRNRAIADYLRSNGYEEAYSTFKKEAELDNVSKFGLGTYICTH